MAEVNGNETTTYNEENLLTKDELETVTTVELGGVPQVSGDEIGSPNPIDVSAVNITKTAVTQNVTGGNIAQPSNVSFDTVSTNEEITDESLNRNTKTLKLSVDSELKAFTNRIIASLGGITGSANNAFSNIKVQMDDQATEVDGKLDFVVDKINLALKEVRDANKSQSNDVASKINLVSGELQANINKVKVLATDAQNKIQQLDDVYLSDEDFAQRVEAVNTLLETLRNADFDIVGAISGTVAELNTLMRIRVKTIVLNSANGTYNFNLVAQELPELDNDKYGLAPQIVAAGKGDTSELLLSVNNKTKDGFELKVKTLATFRASLVDGSVNPITIDVQITHPKLNPLVFDVDQLDDAWLVDGNRIDSTTVPII